MMRQRSLSTLLTDQLPPLAVAFLVAEFFYKFHSFTLECVAFLATWFVLDWIWSKVRGTAAKSVSNG
ncbi:MAG: hypothetical protein EXR03_05430 [Pseudolabrys sp.]|nr:hypothetical protein [Pseudolabrys sp.]MSP32249.1 hypothetical protein [Pseudolabrys sp.]